MNSIQKELTRTAIISSPIIAAFELSPLYFLSNQTVFEFWRGIPVVSLLCIALWIWNIILFTNRKRRIRNQIVVYVLSYLSLPLITYLIFLFLITHFPFERFSNALPFLFPLINILALNTIILIIANAIIMKHNKIDSESELGMLKIKHLEAEQQQLIQQLQPHFLFNALSTLKSLIKNNPDLAEEYLLKLSDFLRFTITAHANYLIPLRQELQFTNDYIDLQKVRFQESFEYTINIPDKILPFKIPVYALQTLVENAIKHNGFTEEHPLRLNIYFCDPFLVVSNNKIPKATPSAGNGIGLYNLKKRYSLLDINAMIVEDTPTDFCVKLQLIPSIHD